DFEAERVLRIVIGNDAGAIHGEAEHLVVYQRIADELRRLVVGEGVTVEVVRQVEPASGDPEALTKEFGAQPRFAQVQLVLIGQARGVAVQQCQRRNLAVGRGPAQRDHVGEEARVLRKLARENQSADASAYAFL